MASYAIFVLFAGATAVKDASGIVGDVANGSEFYCFPDRICEWGLMNSYSVSKPVQVDVRFSKIIHHPYAVMSSLVCTNIYLLRCLYIYIYLYLHVHLRF
jgi:hypothetical protein